MAVSMEDSTFQQRWPWWIRAWQGGMVQGVYRSSGEGHLLTLDLCGKLPGTLSLGDHSSSPTISHNACWGDEALSCSVYFFRLPCSSFSSSYTVPNTAKLFIVVVFSSITATAIAGSCSLLQPINAAESPEN